MNEKTNEYRVSGNETELPVIARGRWFDHPQMMNIELTTKCPLRCPQCYCDLENGKDIDKDIAIKWLKDAAVSGIRIVCLSGGETLCYPHLTDLIRECKKLGLESNIALSGALVTKEKLLEIIEAGVTGIYVSLNGSTSEINGKSRDGFELAIKTLELLKEINFENRGINWVMHSFNADDFENIVRIAEEMKVKTIDVMVFKPDSHAALPSVPSGEQIRTVAKFIKNYEGPVEIGSESCFSQMRMLLKNSFVGNMNIGVEKGCGAGRDSVSINIDGKLTPCRHLNFAEEFDNIEEYWNKSEFLEKLRTVEETITEPCADCRYSKNCLPCMDINYRMKGIIQFSNDYCDIKRPK